MQSSSSDNFIHRYNVNIFNIFDPELQLINSKLVIKNKLKELLNELKKFRGQTIVVLGYKKRNDRKTFHSSTKLVASDLDIDEAFKSMHQSVIRKMKKYVCENWNALDVVIR